MDLEIPHFLYQKLVNQYGEELANSIVDNYHIKRKVTFRRNRLKGTIEEIENVLKENHLTFTKVEWLEDAFILEEGTEEDLRKLSMYEEGKIYLQSLSSMLPVFFLEPKEKESILDMAAAPGGKTTQIASMTQDTSLITACEKNKIRLDRLRYNMEKQGVKRYTLLNEDARYLDEFFSFDKILLDAPCSGSGTIQLPDKDIEKHFQEKLIQKSIDTQYQLLTKAVELLKPGHEMIYSTCSILIEENEKQIEKILATQKVELIPISMDNLPCLPTKLAGTIVLCPNEFYEGFFVAKLRKVSVHEKL